MKITNRKLLAFFISLAAIIVLAFFGKETTAVVGLFSVYCAGNVFTKLSAKNHSIENLEENSNITKKEV